MCPVLTRLSMGVTSPLSSLLMSLVRMTICKYHLIIKQELLTQLTTFSDLESSHVVPGLIHKCYLAKSKLPDVHYYSAYISSPQKMVPPSLSLELANHSANLYTRSIWRSSSSG